MPLAHDNSDMTSPGRDKSVTADRVFRQIHESQRPVSTAPQLAEDLDVARPTIKKRLEEIDDPRLETIDIGGAEAYYVTDLQNLPVEEHHKRSIVEKFTDKFVGLPTAPWTAVHPNDGPAEAGDKIQIRVGGIPGRWREMGTHSWERRREKLIYEETTLNETQALISGELYAKPTVPIEHVHYLDDYDLELNIGARYEEVESDGRKRQILIATGVKNYLIYPCDDAVFLQNVSVDWMSPKGHGQELETHTFSTAEMEELLDEDEDDWDGHTPDPI